MNRTTRALTGLAVGAALAVGVTPAQADVTGSKALQGFNIQGQGGQQLNSANSKAVYCQMKRDGFNTAVLNFTLAQDTRTSTVIHTRSTVHGRSGTPTDAQLVQATRNARACGLEVYYKPHLEIEAGGWRARIGTKGTSRDDVRNGWSDAKNKAWHKAWQEVLLRYAKIGKREHFAGIEIGTEHWGTTLNTFYGHTLNKNNGKRMAATAKAVKLAVGKDVMVAYAPHTRYELRTLPKEFCQSKYLDRLDPTWYPNQQNGKDSSVKRLQADMQKEFKTYFDIAWNRCKKPMVPAEIGFLSLKYDSRSKQYDGATWRDVDLTLQRNQYEALLSLKYPSYIKGLMLYRVVNDPKAGGKGDWGFTWQGKPADAVIKKAFR